MEPGIVAGAAFSDDGDVIDLQGTSDGWVMQLDYATAIDAASHSVDVVSVFPNPAASQLTVDLKNNTGTATLRIKNLYGKQLSFSTAEGRKTSVDVSNYPSGIYFMEIAQHNGSAEPKVIAFEVMR